jgi:hypothetical protein
MALTTEELKALHSFGRSPEGRRLVAMLEERLTGYDVTNRRRAGDDLLRGLGRAIELEELIKLLTEPPKEVPRPGQAARPGVRTLT